MRGGLILLEKKSAERSSLEGLLRELENGLKNIFYEKLKKIIIYGSYARGKSDEGSDLDIMVLVGMSEEEIKKSRDKVLDLVVNLTTRYGIVISIIENNYNYFYEWVEVLPFFANVEKEGVKIYGG
jgi:predicted nucleotidyltransferase